MMSSRFAALLHAYNTSRRVGIEGSFMPKPRTQSIATSRAYVCSLGQNIPNLLQTRASKSTFSVRVTVGLSSTPQSLSMR